MWKLVIVLLVQTPDGLAPTDIGVHRQAYLTEADCIAKGEEDQARQEALGLFVAWDCVRQPGADA